MLPSHCQVIAKHESTALHTPCASLSGFATQLANFQQMYSNVTLLQVGQLGSCASCCMVIWTSPGWNANAKLRLVQAPLTPGEGPKPHCTMWPGKTLPLT